MVCWLKQTPVPQNPFPGIVVRGSIHLKGGQGGGSFKVFQWGPRSHATHQFNYWPAGNPKVDRWGVICRQLSFPGGQFGKVFIWVFLNRKWAFYYYKWLINWRETTLFLLSEWRPHRHNSTRRSPHSVASNWGLDYCRHRVPHCFCMDQLPGKQGTIEPWPFLHVWSTIQVLILGFHPRLLTIGNIKQELNHYGMIGGQNN